MADTIEGNKLIAEFVGKNIMTTYTASNGKDYSSSGPVESVKDWSKAFLQYHSSWNHLHSAWEKFRHCITIEGNPTTKYYRDYNNHLQRTGNAIINLSIEEVFERLVEAIQWLNNQKQ